MAGRRAREALPCGPEMSATPDQSRGCLGTLGVLVVMLLIVGGGAVAAGAVADLPDAPVSVGRGVTVQPPAGWQFVGREDDVGGVLLTSGGASVFIEAVAGGDEVAALRALRDEWSVEPLLMTGEIERSEIRPGVAAARFAYTGSVEGVAAPIEGEVTALRGAGYVVVFDGWAGLGDYLSARGEIEQMIVTAVMP